MSEPTEGPSRESLEAMSAERMIVPVEMCDGVYAIDPETAALVADRLVAAAVEKERARCRKIVKRQLTSAFASDVMHRQAIVAAIESGDTDE